MIHLDTSYLIRANVKGTLQADQLGRWFAQDQVVQINTVAWAEFLCGPAQPDENETALAQIMFPQPQPFLKEDAQVAAKLFNATGRRRGSLQDCMIAATAIRFDAQLATANPADFQRFKTHGLRLWGEADNNTT